MKNINDDEGINEFFEQVKKIRKFKNAREFYGEEEYQRVREIAREIDKRLAEKDRFKKDDEINGDSSNR